MENLSDFINTTNAIAVAVAGAVTKAFTWIAGKFEWWKNSESKLVKIVVPLGLFVFLMLLLSALT